MKKILILMLSVVMVFALSVSLFSCGDTECTTHVDENNDGKCDNCTADMPNNPDSGEVTLTTHEEFMAAEAGAEITVETYVQASQGWWNEEGVDVTSLYTENEDGGYFIYQMPCTEEEYNKLTPGTKIRVKGYKLIWNGLHEIGDATFEIIEGDTYVASATDITDKLATEDIINYQSMKYVAKNLTVVEFKDGQGFGYGWDGNSSEGADIYFNLSDGTNTYSFLVETYLSGNDSEVYEAAKALKVGDLVTVEGFVYWYEGFQAHATSITATSTTSHEEFMAAEDGEEITIVTYVQASQGWWNEKGVDVTSLYTENEDGGYFIYQMPCTEENYNKLTPGTRILVKGYKLIWNGLHEIGDATFEILNGAYVSEPTDITEVIATDDIVNYQCMKYVAKNLTVVEFKDGKGFGYGWDGSGTDGADIYFNLSDGTNTYSFVIETYLSGNDSEVYEAAKALKVGDVVTVEGFVYWYEGFQAHVTVITPVTAE